MFFFFFPSGMEDIMVADMDELFENRTKGALK